MWPWYSRILLGVLVAIGFGFGWLAQRTEPPRTVEITLFFVLVLGGGLLAGWYRYRAEQSGQFDERSEEIERRARQRSYTTLIALLGGLVGANLFVDLGGYLDGALIALLVGGIIIDDLYIEWYRRKL